METTSSEGHPCDLWCGKTVSLHVNDIRWIVLESNHMDAVGTKAQQSGHRIKRHPRKASGPATRFLGKQPHAVQHRRRNLCI